MNRISYLDGIRGWASLMVVLSHLIGLLSIKNQAFQLNSLPILYDGHFAVIIFFVLSGTVLSVNRIGKDKTQFSQDLVKRYVRLTLPIFCTSLITYIFMKNSLFLNNELSIANYKYQDWIGSFFNFKEKLIDVFMFSFFDVVFNYDRNTTYNSSLWTIYDEFCGSIAIFLLFKYNERHHVINLKLIFFVLTLLLYKRPNIGCFFLGYLVALQIVENNSKQSDFEEFLYLLLFGTTILIVNNFKPTHDWMNCILAFVLIFTISKSHYLKCFFFNRISAFLGKISFPLYLIQIVIICSFTSYLILNNFFIEFGDTVANFLILTLTLVVCFSSALLLTTIDTYSVLISKKSGRIFQNILTCLLYKLHINRG